MGADKIPACLEHMHGEVIRKHLNSLHPIGFEKLIAKVESFLHLTSIFPGDSPFSKIKNKFALLPSIIGFGRSGIGKTTFGYQLFTYIADKLDCDFNFFLVRFGSLLNPNLGQTSRNIEEIFEFLAHGIDSNELAFVQFDEIDAITLSRNRSTEHDAIRRALSSFLISFDNMLLAGPSRWIIYATSNIPQLIDPALWRRFYLKLDFDAYQWPPEMYNQFICQLLEDTGYKISSAKIKQISKFCLQRELTPYDIQSLVKDSLIDAVSGGISFHGFINTLLANARNWKATPVIAESGAVTCGSQEYPTAR
jgi:SpoVK/Ycf46/Vps4 family AAA+-type ATPase